MISKKETCLAKKSSRLMSVSDVACRLSILDPYVGWLVDQGRLEARELDGQLLILSDSFVRLKRSWRKS